MAAGPPDHHASERPQRVRHGPATPRRRPDDQQRQRDDARRGVPADDVVHRVGHRLRAAAHAGQRRRTPLRRLELAGHRLGLRPPVPQPHRQPDDGGRDPGLERRPDRPVDLRTAGARAQGASPAPPAATRAQHRQAAALLLQGTQGRRRLRSRARGLRALSPDPTRRAPGQRSRARSPSSTAAWPCTSSPRHYQGSCAPSWRTWSPTPPTPARSPSRPRRYVSWPVRAGSRAP